MDPHAESSDTSVPLSGVHLYIRTKLYELAFPSGLNHLVAEILGRTALQSPLDLQSSKIILHVSHCTV